MSLLSVAPALILLLNVIVIPAVILFILYLIIKTAVRNGILEAHKILDENKQQREDKY